MQLSKVTNSDRNMRMLKCYNTQQKTSHCTHILHYSLTIGLFICYFKIVLSSKEFLCHCFYAFLQQLTSDQDKPSLGGQARRRAIHSARLIAIPSSPVFAGS